MAITNALYRSGYPVKIPYTPPTTAVNAGDIVVVGGVAFIAHSDIAVLEFGELTLAGGVYQLTADAAYPVGMFVFWNVTTSYVTAVAGANCVPLGFIVAGPTGQASDGGPTAAGSVCYVYVLPEPEMRFGSAVAAAGQFSTFNDEGNVYRSIGNPIAGNAADTTDDVLGGFVLGANCFDGIGNRGLCITAQGVTGATTNNKRFKVWANPTLVGSTTTAGVISGGTVSGAGSGVLLADSGAWVNGTTPNNAQGWSSMVNLFKYGIAGSNTQYSQASNILGTLHGGMSAPVFTTLVESAAITIVVTGSSYTTGAASDMKLDFLEANAMN